jgi:ABC-type sugar transport system substrate-binding protein
MATRRQLLSGVASAVLATPLLPRLASAADPALKVANPTIGVVVPQLLIEFWNYLAFMKVGAKQLGVNLVVVDAQNSPERMISSIQDLASRKVDGIIFTAYWSTGTRGLTIAKQAGIPVAIADTHPDYPPQTARFPNYITFVGPSDEDMGASIGKALIDATPADADGKKRIGIVNGTAGTSVAVNRRKGFAALLKQHPEVIVEGEVNGDFERETAQAAFEAFYIGHSGIRGVWVASGGMASGVLTALHNRGKQPGKDVMVVCIDLEKDNRPALQNGELLFDMGGHWLSGGFALLALYDAIQGHVLPANVADVHMLMLPLTQPYVADFNKDFPNNLPNFDFRAHSLTYNSSVAPGNFQVPYVDFFRSRILSS